MVLKKALRIIAVLIVLGLIVAQFVGPKRTNPPVDATKTLAAITTVPADVTEILRKSCNDCHSNESVWPWYAHVAPVSWFVIDHVNDGRRHLNFSTWADYPAEKRAKKLGECAEEVEGGEMPLASYLRLHADAKLTPEAKARLLAWFNGERAKLPATTKKQPGK